MFTARRRFVSAFALGGLWAASLAARAAAAPVALTTDLVHSRAEFTVSHLVLSKVWGHIPIRKLEIEAEPGSVVPAKIDATLDPAHEDTDNHDRDADLRSATYFDVEQYPAITFKSTKIGALEGSDFPVTGDLTIKGITKQVTFHVHVIGVVPTGDGGSRVGYECNDLHIDRRDFNMVDQHLTPAGVLIVGYDVTIGLTAEAVSAGKLVAPAPAPSATK